MNPTGKIPHVQGPGHLRRLAMGYIAASEKELESLGLAVRSAMELEFTVDDADPLICQALTMAAILQTVRQHMQWGADGSASDTIVSTSCGNFIVGSVTEDIRPDFGIPGHGELVRRFASDRSMRDLLGHEFHRAILQEYGKNKASRA